MTAPNDVQRAALKGFQGYRVAFQFTTGELLIVPDHDFRYAKIIDTCGHVYGYREYMLTREHRRSSHRRARME